MSLKPHEKVFLDEQKKIQDELISKIEKIQKELIYPITSKYEEVSEKINDLESTRKAIGLERRNLYKSSGLNEAKSELSSIAKDVTKLLRKERGAKD